MKAFFKQNLFVLFSSLILADIFAHNWLEVNNALIIVKLVISAYS